MSSKINDLVGLLLAEIADEKHKTELKQCIDNGDINEIVKSLKRHRKLENQRVRNKKCYYKKKETPTEQSEIIQFN